MNQHRMKILIVDDEVLNRVILEEYLEDANFDIEMAEDGESALAMLQADETAYDIVLLDRMMPGLSGMDVLQRIKEHPVLKSIPVILQTARAAKEDIVEGLAAGAHYYLTKPFEQEELLSVIRTAVEDRQRFRDMNDHVKRSAQTMGLMQVSKFRFKTLDEGRSLASVLANACPDPERVAMGLSELIINAVEHGNLGITYDEKSTLNDSGIWHDEVVNRLALPENQEKFVQVFYEKEASKIRITITDEGEGFDWEPFMEMQAERAFDNHGRGIALSNMSSFDDIEYRGSGNEVVASIMLEAEES
ncbi:MAG: response regulator [Gammaproteobacteria bacterium]